MLNKGGMGNLLKQAQKMQEDFQKAQANLVNVKVSGSAGGNMVTVTANAAQEILEIKIDKEVVDPQEVEMLEDLILAAVNQALTNAKAKASAAAPNSAAPAHTESHTSSLRKKGSLRSSAGAHSSSGQRTLASGAATVKSRHMFTSSNLL